MMRFYVELEDSKIVTFAEPDMGAYLSHYPQHYLLRAKRIWKEKEDTGEFYEMVPHEPYKYKGFHRHSNTSEEAIKEFVWIKLRAHNV